MHVSAYHTHGIGNVRSFLTKRRSCQVLISIVNNLEVHEIIPNYLEATLQWKVFTKSHFDITIIIVHMVNFVLVHKLRPTKAVLMPWSEIIMCGGLELHDPLLNT